MNKENYDLALAVLIEYCWIPKDEEVEEDDDDEDSEEEW